MAMWMQILLWVLLGVFGLWVLVAAARSGRPVRGLVTSGTQGLCALGLVNLFGTFTGVSLGVSWLAAGAAVGFGMPGVIALLVLKILLPAG